jgi:hypothetical protein
MGERRELNPRMVDPQSTALIHLATSAPTPAHWFQSLSTIRSFQNPPYDRYQRVFPIVANSLLCFLLGSLQSFAVHFIDLSPLYLRAAEERIGLDQRFSRQRASSKRRKKAEQTEEQASPRAREKGGVCRRARSLFLRLRLLFPTCASAHVARGRSRSFLFLSDSLSRAVVASNSDGRLMLSFWSSSISLAIAARLSGCC